MNYLMIPCVEFPVDVAYEDQPRYVANTFLKQNIAKINDITLIPYWRNGVVVYVGFITILEWLDTENSYNFIQKLKNPSKETRMVYDDDDWWVIQLNTGDECNFAVENYTVYFSYPTDFDEEVEVEDVEEVEVEVKVEEVEVEEVEEVEDVEYIPMPVLERERGIWSCAVCHTGESGPFSLCYNIDCSEFMKTLNDFPVINEFPVTDQVFIPKPVLERERGIWSCAVCHTGESGPFSLCYNIDCSEFTKTLNEFPVTDQEFIPMDLLVDDDDDDTDELPVLERSQGQWTCSKCKEYTGSMYSSCKNENCDWFKMGLLEIVTNFKNDEQWKPINQDKTVCFDDVPPNVIPPMSWLNDDTDIPELEFENTHECGLCCEPKRNMFSVCWNVMCERYGKNLNEVYPDKINFDNFNFDTRNVTFRKSNKVEV